MNTTADPSAVGWRFEASYTRLPDAFHAPATPARVSAPRTAVLNHRLAADLGLNLHALSPESAAALFAGQTVPAGAQPLAQAYAGHQFGHFTMLGDGRAILLGEHRTPAGALVDVQFKGTGRTRYSRGGDGKAALGPMLREYIIGEAMAGLGIPTTRGLAVVTTGEPLFRDGVKPGAILTRVAASHLRVGTFEYAAARGDEAAVRALADYAIARHDPELASAPDKYLGFLRSVCDRQAALLARWQLVGFVHGVMNTDNTAVSGESIDFGPCAFMNGYDPKTVFSSIDHAGRYAYGNQPAIAQWNLARLAESLLPLLDADQEKAVAQATPVLEDFAVRFQGYWLTGMRTKLGLRTTEADDPVLIRDLLSAMQRTRADWTNTFRDLSAGDPPAGADDGFREWHARWRERMTREGGSSDEAFAGMRSVNPAVIPRNHLVEAALSAAEERADLTPLHELVSVLTTPFAEPASPAYREPPADEAGYRTFCGT